MTTLNDQIMPLTLCDHPNAYGFFYGHLTLAGGRQRAVSILPPREVWQGAIMPTPPLPDREHFIVFVDGVEFGRVTSSAEAHEMLRELAKQR